MNSLSLWLLVLGTHLFNIYLREHIMCCLKPLQDPIASCAKPSCGVVFEHAQMIAAALSSMRLHSEHTASTQRAHSAHTARTQRAHSEHTARTQRAHSEHTASTQRAHSAHTASTQRAHSAHAALLSTLQHASWLSAKFWRCGIDVRTLHWLDHVFNVFQIIRCR